MNYQWYELSNIFDMLDLEIYDIELEIDNINEYSYMFNGRRKIGSVGKTCWYIPLDENDKLFLSNTKKACGLKIIKYPVYHDIWDEYCRLLQEYSIQKLLNNKGMAPDIHKLILVKNSKKIVTKWLSKEMIYPAESIFFAQIVEHITRDDSSKLDIRVNNKGEIYGSEVNKFVDNCKKMRIVPYDLNIENLYVNYGKLKVLDVHKWKRSYEIIPPYAPKYIQIELNNSCNAKCKMCNIPNMKRLKGQMTDELYIKILKEANELGVEYITPFLHGEPFLRKDFVEKLNMINKYAPNSKITIFTNASLLSEKIIKEISTIKNIEQIVFSFPGGNKEVYEKVTSLNFESTIVNIKKAFAYLKNVNMRISLPKCNQNESSEKDFFRLWKGYPCSSYDTYNYLGNVSGTLSSKCYEQCDRAFRSMTILHDGKICLCCMDSEGDYIMGDISKASMLDIWNNDNYRELRAKHGICRMAYKPCKNCTLDLKTEEYNNAYNSNNL